MGQIYPLTPSGGIKVRWVGTTDFAELYRFIKNWLEDRGFVKEERDLERKYVERRSGGAKLLEIAWHGEQKISEYYKLNMDVTFLIIGVTEIEAQIGDVKRKLDKGDFEIRISSNVEITDDKWNQYSLLKKIYFRIVARKRLPVYKREIYIKTYELQDAIKEFLALRRA